jgi:hypothetical protein
MAAVSRADGGKALSVALVSGKILAGRLFGTCCSHRLLVTAGFFNEK